MNCGDIHWKLGLKNRPKIYGRYLQSIGSWRSPIEIGVGLWHGVNPTWPNFADWWLVGGLEHVFSIQVGMSSSQLTKSIIFQRGRAQPPTRWWLPQVGKPPEIRTNFWVISLVSFLRASLEGQIQRWDDRNGRHSTCLWKEWSPKLVL